MNPLPMPNPFNEIWKESVEKTNYNQLRDHFAGLALQGMLANSQQQEYFDDNIAHLAYSLANSMMKVRNNGTT